ncbi:tetratricopeptide repeat-containing sensor histidine kinase [Snuella sedimenti]|uniref:histidine kinase n=1 Tax=Snuella sedimenti TaxID=2798802 RepID=A0A8J7LXK4_9FLAO|nr:ATP-binding protein [Snuella sedimenti]MBJ6366896.1 tetratricopeptide repeat-containing sensor histidine kinase [Snuella sedimenti]
MRKTITLIIIIFLSAFYSFSQTKELDSLSIQLAFQSQDTLKVDTSLNLIKSLYDLKDYDRALKYIIESDRLASSLNYKKGIAEITYYRALIFAQKNDYINATSNYSKSKALFNDLNDTLGIAKVNNSIGLIEIKRGNYTKGLQYSLAAIDAFKKRNLKSELVSAYTNLAEAYYNVNDIDNSIAFNLKALDLQEVLNDKSAIINSQSNLAKLYSIKREHRKAIEYYEKVIASIGNNNDSIRGAIFPKLGGEYLKFRDYEKATGYLLQGLQINRRTKNESGLLTTLINLGDLNFQQRKFILAEKQLLEAGSLAKNLGNNEELLKQYKLMKAIDSTKRDFASAFVWQRRYYDLKNQISNENLSRSASPLETTDLDANNDFNKSNEVIENLSQNNNGSGNRTTLNRFKLISYLLLAAFAIVSTFLILIYIKRNSNIKYTQELEEKNIKIQLQNEAYQKQTEQLENANNVKDKLFSIVSHDLKDSLSSINGFINLLQEGTLSKEEFDNLIPELSENANNASLLLYNLLNWSKSQMHSLEPKPSLFDIQEVFEDKVKLVEKRMENKGIALVDHSLRDFAYADRSMFEIVIQNLLANALKFCKSGDTITISNHISNGSCIVSIADTGIGISKENMEKLFSNTTFTTVGTNNEKGTGLGLSICKELIELNNGKIWVESTLNEGSTFYVQLPKSKPA